MPANLSLKKLMKMANYSLAKRHIYQTIGYPIEAAGAALLYGLFALLPIDAASRLGGWIGRFVGPRLSYHKRAIKSLKYAFPEYTHNEILKITMDMWDNFGRVLAELPHLETIINNRLEILNEEHIISVKPEGNPCIFLSGHFANWEILPPAAQKAGVASAQVYRAANNHFVDSMLRKIRKLKDIDSIPKGSQGAREIIATLKSGRRLGMLVDQKMNDGIPIKLFGRIAMTAPAVAQLSIKYACPAIPLRIIRTDGCHFQMQFYAAMDKPIDGDVTKMMREINMLFEEWATEYPAQWLGWLHRRWPED
ncbi:MAG: lauroyl acyltransferase [Rhodospirillaceae bacterium]|nr:lauroyl acyltransferase [Rhodospirillaceae bacterium]